jgi:hypothetical protein
MRLYRPGSFDYFEVRLIPHSLPRLKDLACLPVKPRGQWYQEVYVLESFSERINDHRQDFVRFGYELPYVRKAHLPAGMLPQSGRQVRPDGHNGCAGL